MGNIETGSFGERVRRARGELTQEHVLSGMRAHGFDEPQTWLSRIELGQTKRIDFDKLSALAAALGEDPLYLMTGERRADDTPFVARMRAFERELDSRGKYIVESLAALEVEESRKRAADALTEEEAEMLRLFRSATPGQKRSLLVAAGSEEASAPRRESPHQGSQSPSERIA